MNLEAQLTEYKQEITNFLSDAICKNIAEYPCFNSMVKESITTKEDLEDIIKKI